MMGMDKHKHAGQSVFMSSMQGLANVLAIIATFLGTGPMYTATHGWVFEFAVSHYGQASADFVTLIWGVICGAFIFFIARASIGTALMFGAIALMTRLV